MRVLLIVVGVLVALVLLVVIVGYLLPVKHVVTVSAPIPAPPDSVWAALTRPKDFPSWRPDVAAVDTLPDQDGHASWRETGKNGAISFVVEQAERPHRLVTRITDKSLPFGGAWEYVVTPEGAGSRVRITERGEVYNPVFRFMSRFVMGHSATARAYLVSLGRKYGAEVAPVVEPQMEPAATP
jgi:uncharacterized protein YndB with AHSA1/START domain